MSSEETRALAQRIAKPQSWTSGYGSGTVALAEEVLRLSAALEDALHAIQDIDRHATPYGTVAYVVSVGSLHRALALIGGQAKCSTLACTRAEKAEAERDAALTERDLLKCELATVLEEEKIETDAARAQGWREGIEAVAKAMNGASCCNCHLPAYQAAIRALPDSPPEGE